MVGVFPPPVHGMSMINAAVYEHLCARRVAPLVLDLAPASLSRSWCNRFSRIRKVIKSLVRYWSETSSRDTGTIYIGLSGGWGQLYEALFVLIARFRGVRIFLHHHSFAYLDRRKIPAQLLLGLAGRGATQIVICERQAQRLRECYSTGALTRVVSNAAIMGDTEPVTNRNRTQLRRLGFLGNISREKGIIELLAVAEQLECQNSGLEVHIAGPFEDNEAELAVRGALTRFHSVKYVGPRYGPEKETFWDLIDVLLFPSQYQNETAPLVVHEAMGHGIPVIAWDRGCLSAMVPPNAGLLVDRNQDFVSCAVECVLRWQRDGRLFADVSSAAGEDFRRQYANSRGSFEALLDDLCKAVACPESGDACTVKST